MIYTRFGSEVELLDANLRTGNCLIRFLDDGGHMDCTLSDLKADDGIAEIDRAIKDLSRTGWEIF